MLIAVQFSIKISSLTNQVKNLAQDNALMRTQLDRMVSGSDTPVDGPSQKRSDLPDA
jgi:hypothetical protein